MKKYINLSLLSFLLVPAVASAQLTDTKKLIEAVGGLINPLLAVLTGLALAAFLWGLAKFIYRAGGDEKAVEEGKRVMKWGILALFIMISIWGIISFIQGELNLTAGGGGVGGGGGGGGDSGGYTGDSGSGDPFGGY